MTDPATTFLQARGISRESIDRFGLRYHADRHAVEIPFVSALGDVTAHRYRSLNPNAKAKMLPEKKGDRTHLFNVVDSGTTPVYLTEGEFDCIILKQLGLNAVGTPGANGFQAAWRWLFQDCDVRIIFDGDDAGKKGAQAVARLLARQAASVAIIDMPAGKDVNDLYLEGRLQGVLSA